MIRVYDPWMATNQRKYVLEAVDSNMLTFHGRFLEEFEHKVAAFLGVKHCIAVSNGSVALYAMYSAADLKGKRVVTSSMTYAATVAQLILVGADVCTVDCNQHLQMETFDIRQAIEKYNPHAIVVPALYADMPDMVSLHRACGNIVMLEDAAEAFGCSWLSIPAGRWGKMAAFSFFANKVVTCGEGGAIVTDDDDLALWLRKFINQGVTRRFWHEMIGTNFRMTNLQAAVGCAQMEDVTEILRRKQSLANFYRHSLHKKFECIKPVCGRTSEWMPVFRLPARDYQEFEAWMLEGGIETRPVFTPVHMMPAFRDKVKYLGGGYCEVAPRRHFILPSSPSLTDNEMVRVVERANDFILN